MYSLINADLKDAVVLSPRRRRRNLDTAGRVGFLRGRPGYIQCLERLLGSWTECRNSRQFNQVSQPVVILIEEQLNRIRAETILLFFLGY